MSVAEFYVAPDGNDDWSGLLEAPRSDGQDGPFATLDRARRAVRELLDSGLDRDVIVFLRGGLYEVGETVVFGPEDSPTKRFSVTYAAYPGERPVLSAAEKIDQWRPLPENEVPAGMPEKAAKNVWIADLDEVRDGRWRFHALYDGEKRLPRASTESFEPLTPEQEGELKDKRTLYFPEGQLRRWPHLEDVELVIRPHHPWVLNILGIEEVDEEEGVARTTIPGTYELRPVSKWARGPEGLAGPAWVENVPEGMTAPGRWFLDGRLGRLYFWPRGEEPGQDIRAARTREVIQIDGGEQPDRPVRHLVFDGITFTHGDRDVWAEGDAGIQHDWEMLDKDNALVRFRGAEDCRVKDCTFRNSAGTGVRLDLHCQHNTVESCEFAHLGGTGILLCGFGPGHLDVNHDNDILDNHVHHCGEIYWHNAGIFVWQSGHNRIAHNLVHDTPYNALVLSGVRPGFFTQPERRECGRTIRFDEIGGPGRKPYEDIQPLLHCRDNLVEYNEIHSAVQTLWDGNGIYISGTGPQNVVRRNYLHDILGRGTMSALRMDDWQMDTLIEENIIWNCVNVGIILKGVNRIERNIIAGMSEVDQNGFEAPVKGYIALRHTGDPTSEDSRIRGNIFCHGGEGAPFYEEDRAPIALSDLDVDFNLYFSADDMKAVEQGLEERRARGLDTHGIVADPEFADFESGDLRIAADSPIWKVLSEQFNISLAGQRLWSTGEGEQ
ncbi:MAG: right-handed parallel beta-helix repeat-containing protein [Planctomycetes bacterium]|nr:right-handed parallel beta-helix repeat-containing protein [Planctomycetota bacterium]